MKKILTALLLSLTILSFSALAHHAADGIVSEETYELIESLIETTPHADMTIADLGEGMTGIVITAETLTALMNLIEDGLLEVISSIVGNTTTTIIFNDDGSVTLTVEVQGYNYDESQNRNSDDDD